MPCWHARDAQVCSEIGFLIVPISICHHCVAALQSCEEVGSFGRFGTVLLIQPERKFGEGG